jgi:hypothetical protein
MATNLVSYAMQFLTPDMIGRIGAALGLSRSDAQSGVSAAVPALLAGFSGLADKPGGAQSLVNTIKQQSGVLDNFAGMISGNNQSSFIERGSSLLTSLLGSQDKTALAGAIARSAGLGQSGASSLLGMLAPVVMGLIGKQIGTRGSLTSLLASQKDQIAQALPAGMGRLLESAGLDWLGGAQPARAPAREFEQYTAPAARAVERPPTTSGFPNWAYWALPLLALSGLLWYLLGRPTEQPQVAQQQPAPTTQSVPAPTPQSMVVGGVDIGKQIGESIDDLRTSFQGITDVASATAALPKLQAVRNQIDRVSSLVGQLAPDQRKIVTGLIASAMPTINQLSDKVLDIPGVSEVLRPTIDPVRTKLADLSGQPSTVGSGRRF